MSDRADFTIKANVERVDNGVMLTVRQSSAKGDVITLKKVYTTSPEFVADLLAALNMASS